MKKLRQFEIDVGGHVIGKAKPEETRGRARSGGRHKIRALHLVCSVAY